MLETKEKENIMKSYENCMDKLSEEDLYIGLLEYGFFAEQLPPIFSAKSFREFCDSEKDIEYTRRKFGYITFDTMRNTGVPRRLGIPNPIAYYHLCKCLKECWKDIKQHLKKCTNTHEYKVSQLHIRKFAKSHCIYRHSYIDKDYESVSKEDFLIDAQYVVHTDISACFSSIYTHSLCWALVGKSVAKEKKNESEEYYNKIDKWCRYIKGGETQGILIGPHASQLLSEIILVAVDKELKKWKYFRYIDDYECYVRSQEEANLFIQELHQALSHFNLSINRQKTVVEGAPILPNKDWKNQLLMYPLIGSLGKVTDCMIRYPRAVGFLDYSVSIMKKFNMDVAVLKYAIKVLFNRDNLTRYARKKCSKKILHLAKVYPYLIRILDEVVMSRESVTKNEMKCFSDSIYKDGILTGNYEQVCYALYYALKYSFKLENITSSDLLESNDCILKILGWAYYKKNRDNSEVEKFSKKAVEFSMVETEMEHNWLFVYEVLNEDQLKDYWKELKKKHVTFLNEDFIDICRETPV